MSSLPDGGPRQVNGIINHADNSGEVASASPRQARFIVGPDPESPQNRPRGPSNAAERQRTSAIGPFHPTQYHAWRSLQQAGISRPRSHAHSPRARLLLPHLQSQMTTGGTETGTHEDGMYDEVRSWYHVGGDEPPSPIRSCALTPAPSSQTVSSMGSGAAGRGSPAASTRFPRGRSRAGSSTQPPAATSVASQQTRERSTSRPVALEEVARSRGASRHGASNEE